MINNFTERIAIYPGTFDPITLGHIDIIERAIKLFDRLIVTLAINTKKKTLFSIEERIALIEDAVKDFNCIEVERFEGLLMHFARKKNAVAVIRGLRAISDFEFEFQMALMNQKLDRKITTVFLMPNEKYTYLNSTIVKEVVQFGGDISGLVTPLVGEKLVGKYNTRKK
jgi:pantetheine-phosphate adenylyltransferase